MGVNEEVVKFTSRRNLRNFSLIGLSIRTARVRCIYIGRLQKTRSIPRREKSPIRTSRDRNKMCHSSNSFQILSVVQPYLWPRPLSCVFVQSTRQTLRNQANLCSPVSRRQLKVAVSTDSAFGVDRVVVHCSQPMVSSWFGLMIDSDPSGISPEDPTPNHSNTPRRSHILSICC